MADTASAHNGYAVSVVRQELLQALIRDDLRTLIALDRVRDALNLPRDPRVLARLQQRPEQSR